MKLDVILTCYNRAEKTRQCIERLQSSASKSKYDVRLQFFVCNDGSTDNTSEILREFGEAVFEITGNGKLFWAKGMAAALKAAESTEKDFYLMVNDDVLFEPNVIDILFDNYGEYTEKNPVIVGATKDDRDDSFTYGGYIWNGKALKKKMTPVKPDSKNLYCNTANWNCVLMPAEVYQVVGEIDSNYEHSFADFDYSNRLISAGVRMYVANQYIGTCRRNDEEGTWRDKNLDCRKRIQLLHRPNGFPPKSSWRYARKYYGFAAPIIFIKPYISILLNSFGKKGGNGDSNT